MSSLQGEFYKYSNIQGNKMSGEGAVTSHRNVGVGLLKCLVIYQILKLNLMSADNH
jgi:hypothetical protein